MCRSLYPTKMVSINDIWRLIVHVSNIVFFVNSSASNRIIKAKDHASIQLSLAEVDEATGRITGQLRHYAICGALRRMVSR